MWVFVESRPIKNLSPARIAGAPSKRKKKEKCSEGLSYACSLSARIVTRLYDADRLLENDRATTHQNMWLGECGFCAALYAISLSFHFGNASLPHWSVQSHRSRLLTARRIKLRAWKSVSSFAVFRERFLFAHPASSRKHVRHISFV